MLLVIYVETNIWLPFPHPPFASSITINKRSLLLTGNSWLAPQVCTAQWYKGNGRGEIVDHLFVYFYIVDSIVQWYIQEMLGPAEQICTQYTTKSLVV